MGNTVWNCNPGHWSDAPGSLTGGVEMAVCALADGSVLICGGRKTGNRATAYAWLYSGGSLSALSQPMSAIRRGHSATRLADGRVLIAGSAIPGEDSRLSAEIYDPKTRRFTPTGNLVKQRGYHTATLLANGKVLIAGGTDSAGHTHNSAELYDPASGSFSLLTATMVEARSLHTATLLDGDARVLLVSGSSAEIFEMTNNSFAATAGPKTSRSRHAAVKLANGSVLIAGGYSSGHVSDPREEVWSPNGQIAYTSNALGEPDPDGANFDLSRFGCSLSLLPSGKVLVVGGSTYSGPDQSSPSISGVTRLYDPVAKHFDTVAGAALQRAYHCAVLLPTGQVLVAGGVSIGGPSYPTVVQTFCPEPAPQALHLNFAGSGHGSVQSIPPGLNTSTADVAYFPPGTGIRLTATPAPSRISAAPGVPTLPGRRPGGPSVLSNQFVGWSGDASGSASSIVFTLDHEKTVTATFDEVKGTLVPPPKPPFIKT
jgi:hypothetical protein